MSGELQLLILAARGPSFTPMSPRRTACQQIDPQSAQ